MKTHKATAGHDDQCVNCAYPFDAGDTVLADDTDSCTYCSRACAARHETRLGRISARSAFLPDILDPDRKIGGAS